MSASDELKLEDDAPSEIDFSKGGATQAIDQDAGDDAYAVTGAEVQRDGGIGAIDENDILSAAGPAPSLIVTGEGAGIGAYTSLLIVATAAYISAAVIVWYHLSQYAAPDTFPWVAPMP
jgi:hypothetical protein